MEEERIAALLELEQNLSCSFKELSFLDNALTHRSYINENPGPDRCDNERLEFLGDAVLELCVSDMLMKKFPGYAEGQLSKMRASVVNERPLAEMARRFRLGNYLRLGKGEETSGGREKNSLLANAFEALVAAIYMDGGFDKASNFVRGLFAPLIGAGERELIYRDYKTELQEIVWNRFKETPRYDLIGECGPDHEKVFEMNLTVAGIISTGRGRSKKEAEQEAAKAALERLREGAASSG